MDPLYVRRVSKATVLVVYPVTGASRQAFSTVSFDTKDGKHVMFNRPAGWTKDGEPTPLAAAYAPGRYGIYRAASKGRNTVKLGETVTLDQARSFADSWRPEFA